MRYESLAATMVLLALSAAPAGAQAERTRGADPGGSKAPGVLRLKKGGFTEAVSEREEVKGKGERTTAAPAAASPGEINYQGFLTDEAGNPVTATLSLTCRIYGAPSGGTPLWEETQQAAVEYGLFSVILGRVTRIPPEVFAAGSERYLELQVESQVLTPRTKLTGIGYAFAADVADSALGAGRLGGLALSNLDARFVNTGEGTPPRGRQAAT